MSKPGTRVFGPIGLTAVLALGSAVSAQAQTQAQDSSNGSVTTKPSQAATAPTEEVVVTASRRREKAKDVPATITVLGARQLQALNASSLADYLGQIPGVTTFGVAPGNQQIIIRGITSRRERNQQSATVGTYIDDVAIGSSTADAVGARAPSPTSTCSTCHASRY